MNVSVRPTDFFRPSERCLSVREMSVCPTDVRPSDRFAMGFAMGFATGFAMGFAMGFYTSHPQRARERPPKRAISRVSTNSNIVLSDYLNI